jgi:hypothetical protein
MKKRKKTAPNLESAGAGACKNNGVLKPLRFVTRWIVRKRSRRFVVSTVLVLPSQFDSPAFVCVFALFSKTLAQIAELDELFW